jgi:hypothetical protein
MNFVFENIEHGAVEEAWKDFNDYEEVENFDPEAPMNMLFMPWFLFNWIIELKPIGSAESSTTTIAELFLLNKRNHINADEEMLLLRANRCPYTLCEVVEVKPGVGIKQFDLLRRIEYEVVERSASETLKRGEIIYCATADVAGFRSNIGTGPYPLRPTAKRDVLELRKWIENEIRSEKIRTEHLHEFEYDIRGLYLHLLRGMLAPPTLTNTDGDLLLPQKVYFDIDSADTTFHALKHLAGGVNETDVFRDATIEDGLVVRAEVCWLGGTEEARKRLGGPVLLGLLKIGEGRLVVEVNSKQRADLIRRLVEEGLGNGARYRTTLIEPIETQLQEMWQAATTGASGSPPSGGPNNSDGSGFISLDDAEPELRAIMEDSFKQHWESWFDLPVPALKNMTPREAAKSDQGRELLESLLLLYEHHADNSPNNITNPDVPALRRELGMD